LTKDSSLCQKDIELKNKLCIKTIQNLRVINEIRGSLGPPCIIYLFSPHEKLAFRITYLQVKEGARSVMLNQFAKDFLVAQAIFGGNLDEDQLFHSAVHLQKADRKQQNQRY
jgi:hypothetical protein